MNFNFTNVTDNLSQYSDVLQSQEPNHQKVVVCENCGTTLDDFMDSGFVGCAECYKTFAVHARKFAEDMHGRAIHVGKVPKAEATKAMKRRELEKLIAEKDMAVKSEEYLKADEIKKKIEKLREDAR